MTVKECKKVFSEVLKDIFPSTEIDTFFLFLVEEYLGFTRVDLVLKSDFIIDENTKNLFNKALKRLKNQEPIQYILGKTEFFGLPFLVDKNTLIPRPETEELVAWIIDEVKILNKKSSTKITLLDIGTGSGCIPISLAKNINFATISGIDISEKALKVALKNAELNQVSISFFEMDILKIADLCFLFEYNSKSNFDIIVSNPPYVRELEKKAMNKNVLENEPHQALFVSDENPLVFYEKIADLALLHLSKDGVLFFEINQYLGNQTVDILLNKGFKNVELRKDIFGNDRMIKATF
ncbi:protein-(glutamine-N5) methyltransferase, release factor-specific [Polaribacter gangjinensis]|uniref:Release factor glutamine methyltransferase n=1 Tax=Polaribacter gangjinensis TaxID=574710 RepID=A0A2S7WEL3_9FLAO|nr:peptide chain release factor N(5)-glutamine methyltransferase [Polaribacter gangjinensis]PQJ76078.1 protein-(glutamine-N5) methyltransferase, release factor-specific [Polaribacter gangjinensis]